MLNGASGEEKEENCRVSGGGEDTWRSRWRSKAAWYLMYPSLPIVTL